MSASKLGSVGSVGPLTPNVAAEVHASLLIFTGTSVGVHALRLAVHVYMHIHALRPTVLVYMHLD